MSDKILSQVLPFLKLTLKDYIEKKRGRKLFFTCPKCKYVRENGVPTGNFVNRNNTIMACFHCGFRGTILDIVKLNKDKGDWDKYQIFSYVAEKLGVDYSTPKKLDDVINFYEKSGWDLVPVAKEGKNPIEKAWTSKVHKSKAEWKHWLEAKINIGCKTGECSGVTVLDFDSEIPKELEEYRKEALIQKSTRGEHWFFVYESIFPNVKVVDINCDILNTGKQVVIFPSVTDTFKKEFVSDLRINKMPEELKKYLLAKIGKEEPKEKDKKTTHIKEPNLIKFDLVKIKDGSRHDFLIHFGGILKKKLNTEQTAHVLGIMNYHFCEPPLSQSDLRKLVGSLESYIGKDLKELDNKILEYLRDVGGAQKYEIALGVSGSDRGEIKKRIDKRLFYLINEGLIVRKGRDFLATKKVDWRDDLMDMVKPLNFKVPYFDDIAKFKSGDIILIGGLRKQGKTHLAVNIVKRLVDQGVIPYHVNLEPGSRFANIALEVGLKEGDFKHVFCAEPVTIDFERDAVTIIDWLLPHNYAEVDKLFQKFSEQMYKKGGLLIVFMQLKKNGDWFSENMVNAFPSLSTRYFYDKKGGGFEGQYGYFLVDFIREAKDRIKSTKIPCKFLWDEKLLMRIDELEENKEKI